MNIHIRENIKEHCRSIKMASGIISLCLVAVLTTVQLTLEEIVASYVRREIK